MASTASFALSRAAIAFTYACVCAAPLFRREGKALNRQAQKFPLKIQFNVCAIKNEITVLIKILNLNIDIIPKQSTNRFASRNTLNDMSVKLR
jgi:hypothetical protein